eukprot:CAMPEP_0117467510 /NCGR_PEP_ID=MMETSP0784-20121206/5694_1 /TAXON_ID=39447 /ORGANISM="" /LENGTH=127 /DNA_ID=CAMNT_0005261483 /DNA_START=320 /DNA_END=700 /DNA_ORIENTATION=+
MEDATAHGICGRGVHRHCLLAAPLVPYCHLHHCLMLLVLADFGGPPTPLAALRLPHFGRSPQVAALEHFLDWAQLHNLLTWQRVAAQADGPRRCQRHGQASEAVHGPILVPHPFVARAAVFAQFFLD